MRKYLTEFVGTAVLVFVISTTVRGNAALAPIAIGLTLTAMVFAGGHISGAHYNPAVTLAVWLRGKIATREIPGYVVAQVTGALVAGYLATMVVAAGPAAPLNVSANLGPALIAEVVVTFALAYVVLNVATSSDHPGNSFYGIAIGGTVTAGAVAVGGISGGVFNPAVAFGAAGAGLLAWSTIWVYVVANLAGAALAAIAFRYANPGEFAPSAALPAPRTAVDGDVEAPVAAAVHSLAADLGR